MKDLQKQNTLFDKLGGMIAVNASVDIFYAKVSSDSRINHFFRWIDMETQSYKMKAFLAYAFGAPINYNGKSMKDVHKYLLDAGLNETHFDIVLEHLQATLEELQIPVLLIKEAGEVTERTRSEIFG